MIALEVIILLILKTMKVFLIAIAVIILTPVMLIGLFIAALFFTGATNDREFKEVTCPSDAL